MSVVAVETEVRAAPEAVYDLVADLPRMGRWSPECERVDWARGASSAAPGTRFTGHNRRGWHRWSTHGTVTAADRGREFAFEITSIFNLPVSRWWYRFDAGSSGSCRVTLGTEDRRGLLMKVLGPLATGVRDRAARNAQTMAETLAQLRAAAEPGAETHGVR